MIIAITEQPRARRPGQRARHFHGRRAQRTIYIYIYIYVCICVYVCICIYIYIYIYLFVKSRWEGSGGRSRAAGPAARPPGAIFIRFKYMFYNFWHVYIAALEQLFLRIPHYRQSLRDSARAARPRGALPRHLLRTADWLWYSLRRRGAKCLLKYVSRETPDVTPCRTSPPKPLFLADLARNAWCNTCTQTEELSTLQALAHRTVEGLNFATLEQHILYVRRNYRSKVSNHPL